MNVTEHLIGKLGEEGAEVSQMCSKINSFGLDEVWAEHPELGTNAARLVVEINDFMAVAMMLADRGIIPRDFINDRMITQKQAKVVKYMNYARKRGTLQ